jgi:hypothetical protein
LCGTVRFEISGGLGPIIACHCSICRRSSGSAFACNASVQASRFQLLQGQETISEYESSPGYFRAFCSRCGSPIYGRSARHPAIRRVRLGTLEDNPGAGPAAHVWVGSKASWFDIADSLEQFAEMPPVSYVLPK